MGMLLVTWSMKILNKKSVFCMRWLQFYEILFFPPRNMAIFQEYLILRTKIAIHLTQMDISLSVFFIFKKWVQLSEPTFCTWVIMTLSI